MGGFEGDSLKGKNRVFGRMYCGVDLAHIVGIMEQWWGSGK